MAVKFSLQYVSVGFPEMGVDHNKTHAVTYSDTFCKLCLLWSPDFISMIYIDL